MSSMKRETKPEDYTKSVKLKPSSHFAASHAAINANITICAWLEIAIKNQLKKSK